MRILEDARKRIVVLGGGFAGLAAARTLGRTLKRDARLRHEYEILLVDRNDTHTYTPGLYEVATALREDAAPIVLKRSAAISIEDALAGVPVRFLQDEFVGVDIAKRTVRLRDEGLLHADYLILALGAITNDFGIPGVRDYALSLKTFEDALRIRAAVEDTLKTLCEARIVVAGGGATGVEFCGELVALTRHSRKALGLTCHPQFTLIEAGPRLLAGTPDRVAQIAKRRLEAIGVTVRFNCRIKSVEQHEAVLQTERGEERLPFTLFVWSGGIKTVPVLKDAAAPKDVRGRCIVNDTLALAGNDRVFAAGDASCITETDGHEMIPATAYIAINQGNLAARNVLSRIAGKELERFRPPRKPPMVVPISGKWAIAYVFGVTFSGFPAFLFRLLIDASYFLRVLPPIRALRFFCSSTLVYFRNDENDERNGG